jgi:hypothetical protein
MWQALRQLGSIALLVLQWVASATITFFLLVIGFLLVWNISIYQIEVHEYFGKTGIYLPWPIRKLVDAIIWASDLIKRNGLDYINWYMQIFGLFLLVTEIIAIKRQSDHYQSLADRTKRTVSASGLFLSAGLAVTFLVSLVVALFPKSVAARRAIVHRKLEEMEHDSLYDFALDGLRDDLSERFMIFLNVAGYLGGPILLLGVFALVLNLLFWGLAFFLFFVSEKVAVWVGMPGARAPFAGLILIFFGFALTLIDSLAS